MRASVAFQPEGERASSSALTDRAYTELRNAIGDVVLQPGQPLTESSLSDWLGIGRTPVREALLRLRDEGLIEAIARKGYYVTRISADDAQEIYEMLEGLEGIAIQLATARADSADLARIATAVDAQKAALEADDLDGWVAADEAFHVALVEIAGNQRIRKAIEPLNTQLHRLRVYTIRVRPRPVASTTAHEAQFAAMEQKDGDLARRLLQEHRAVTRTLMVKIIRELAGSHGGI